MVSRKMMLIGGLLCVLPACKGDRPAPEATVLPSASVEAPVAAQAPANAGVAAPANAPAAAQVPAGTVTDNATGAAATTAQDVTGAIIEAGCTYDGRQIEGKEGQAFRISCPPGCEKGQRVYGSGVYTADSDICRAAIHAGAIPAEGGTVTVRLEPGRPAYRGSNQNGIQSSDYGKYSKSYAVLPSAAAAASPASSGGMNPPASGAPAASGSVIEAGCKYNARQLDGKDGDTYQVACPSGCETVGRIYGTGVYTSDTSICSAGIHAGALRPEGGTVTIRLEPGRPAYRGTTQNGIRSRDYGKYSRSFAVVVP